MALGKRLVTSAGTSIVYTHHGLIKIQCCSGHGECGLLRGASGVVGQGMQGDTTHRAATLIPVQTLFPKRRKEKPNSACSPPQPRSRFLPAYKSRATRVTGIVVESLCATFTATAQRRKDTFGAWRTPQQQPLWQEPNAHSLAWNRSGSAAAAIISSQPIITAFRARRGWNSV